MGEKGARIRVLELLSLREHAVAELVPQVGVEPVNLSQHLAVLSGQAELLEGIRVTSPPALRTD